MYITKARRIIDSTSTRSVLIVTNDAAAQLSVFSVNSYVYHKGLGGGFIYEGRIII